MYSTSSLADRMKHEVYPNNEQMDVDKSDLVREVFEIEYRADNDNDNDIATSSNIVTAKRKRTKYSIMQLEILENEFKNNVYLTGRRRTELAKQLSLKEAHIKVWFQNRRMKYKKDMETGRLHNKNINKNMAAQNQHNALVHRLLSYSQNVGCTRVTANTNKCNQNASLCIMKENESISEDIASKKRLDDTLKESATVFMATNSKYKTHNFDTNQINNEMYALHNLNNINNENISLQKPCPTENGAMYYQKLSHESQILANPYKTDLLPAQNLLNMPQANSEVHSSKSYCHPKSDNMPKTFGRDNSNNLLSMPLKSNELSNTMAKSDVNDQDITTPQILTLNTELSQQSNEFSFLIYENVIGLDDIWFN